MTVEADETQDETPPGVAPEHPDTVAGQNAGAPMRVVPIDQIRAYDRNPRQSQNPDYHRIKASIQAQGLDQPLVVTQRPGEAGYMLHGGGNTRLRILHELYEETGDPRFRDVTCIYRPWSGETDVLLAHLRENDLRGPLNFLDKALAVDEAKGLMEAEEGTGAITQAGLSAALRDRGYGLSQGLISQMQYAVERLLPLLPAALLAGMGRPQVERIRQLEGAVRALWLEHAVDSEAAFDETFDALCRRYDGPDWDLANLRRALEAEIAEEAEVSIQTVSMMLEERLSHRHGRGGPTGQASAPAAPVTATPGSARGAEAPDADSEAARRRSTRRVSETSGPTTADGTAAMATAGGNDRPGAEAPPRPAHDNAGTDHGETTRGSGDIKSLRARAWTLASLLAQRNGLSELVQPLPGRGLGFVLTDVPDPALVDQLDEDTLAQISMVWWYLAAVAEMTVTPVDELLPNLTEDSVLRRALEEQDAGLLFSSVWTLDPGHMGFRLWRRLDARNWRDLVALMETYRDLHQAAEAAGTALWP